MNRSRRQASKWLLSALLLQSQRVTAAECDRHCAEGDLACVTELARCHLAGGQPRLAIELLRPLRDKAPPEAILVLARAYVDEKNSMWALRVLYEHLAEHPESCVVRSWIAWLHLESAEFGRAHDALADPSCPGTWAPMRARWQLLAARIERQDGANDTSRTALTEVRKGGALFEDDAGLWRDLVRKVEPERDVPVSLRLELGTGWTSNGLLGSPLDPAATGLSGSSAVSVLDLMARFVPPVGGAVRPVLDAGVRAMWLAADPVKDASYASFLARPGILLGRREPRLLLAWAGQWLLLAGSDDYGGSPRLFLESHRGELELSLTRRLTVFGGAGRSLFRELPRTRTEVDFGLGLQVPLGRASLLGIASARIHDARIAAYDLRGASLLASLQVPLSSRLTVRASALASLDDYPASSGYFDAVRARRDLLLRGTTALYARLGNDFHVGVAYEPTRRDSTAASYSYVDHRVLVRLRFNLDADPWRPATAPSPAGVSFWGGETGNDSFGSERIQDLLRQEDAARRASSCVSR